MFLNNIIKVNKDSVCEQNYMSEMAHLSLAEYRRYNDHIALNKSLTLFVKMWKLAEPLEPFFNPSRQHEIKIIGWSGSSRNGPISRRTLIELNPEYRFKIRRRIFRRDVGNLHGFKFLFSGFEIVATGPSGVQLKLAFGDSRLGYFMPYCNGSDIASYLLLAHLPRIELVDQYIQLSVDAIEIRPDYYFLPELIRIFHEYPYDTLFLASILGDRSLALSLSKYADNYIVYNTLVDRFRYLAQGIDYSPKKQESKVLKYNPYLHLSANNDRNEKNMNTIRIPTFDYVQNRSLSTSSNSLLEAYPLVRHTITDCFVQLGGTFFTKTQFFSLDYPADPRFERDHGDYIDVFGSPSRGDCVILDSLPLENFKLTEAIFIGGRHDFNWYHWIVEYLPRALDQDSQFTESIPFLISSKVPPSGEEALRSLSDREVIRIPEGKCIKVNKLHIVSPAFGVMDNLTKPWTQNMRGDERSIKNLSDHWRGSRQSVGSKRVVIIRDSKNRALLNKRELVNLAVREFGFELIDVNGLSFSEQLTLFSQVEVLLTDSGAIMANYLLMPRGAKVIAMSSEHNLDSPLPAVIAEIANLLFMQVIGKPTTALEDAQTNLKARHSKYSIDPNDLHKAISEFCPT
jgi:hypothetical protein